MAVAVEIRHTTQSPTGRKCRTEHPANKNVVIQIPDRCLTRRGTVKDIVWFPIAVKVGYCSPSHNTTTWRPKGERSPHSGRKGASYSAWSKFKNAAAEKVRHKQIARAITSHWYNTNIESKRASNPAWSDFIDGAGAARAIPG